MHFNVLTIMSFAVIIAVIGHMIFDKTGVPESIFMVLFGLILGPLSGIIEINDLTSIIPHVFRLSIVIILLESGITTDIKEALETMRTSTIFTVIVLITTSLLCSAFLKYIIGWSSAASLILGVICSGTSTLPILYFTSRLKLSPAVNQMLVFESIINDVTIITAVSLIIQTVSFQLNPSRTIISIIQYISLAIIFGLMFSTVWTLILVRLKVKLSLNYLTTLAICLILYAFTEGRGGSGVMAVMIFAISIGNIPEFFRTHLLIRRKALRFFTEIEVMQKEVTFLVKNTFFLLLGLMFNIQTATSQTFVIALTLIVLMIVSRWISYKAIGLFDHRYIDHTLLVSLMVSRGLTAGLTAMMPSEQGLSMPPIADIVVVMILFTNLAATIGFMIYTRKNMN